MSRKKPHFSDAYLDDILERCRTEKPEIFTQTLRQMEKDRGGRYCLLGKSGSKRVFLGCTQIFEKNQNPLVQYNALRLAKFAVDRFKSPDSHYAEPWELYLKTIFHPDGRVRVAGVQFLDRYYFGIGFDLAPSFWRPRKNKQVEEEWMDAVGRFVIEKFFYLQDLEERYMNEHKRLRQGDLPDMGGRLPWASDTHDKFLKSIRMGIEALTLRGPLEELMQKYGFNEKTSEEFHDLTIFGRYEKISNLHLGLK